MFEACARCSHRVAKTEETVLHVDFGGRMSTDCKDCAEIGEICLNAEIKKVMPR